ncbi:MAG: tRNA lysidine(34) synthetase TilS [Vicinamibacterales bacterium]
MTSLPVRVRRYAARHGLWTPDARVLAAVSGGSDSVALLLVLHLLAREGHLRLAGVAHVHHHLRAEADADERFVRDLAASLGVPCDVQHVDVRRESATRRLSIEVAAREARHAALAAAAAAAGADLVATAHTRDDQAETVLMRLVRGAGPLGLGGIDPRRGGRVRPLLEEDRAGLRAWLEHAGQDWREDASNLDLAQPRNRLRHDVLPRLARHFNPAVALALSRAADIAREDERYLAVEARRAADRIVHPSPERIVVQAAALSALPAAMGRRVARVALETACPGQTYGLEEVTRVLACAAGGPGADLPGVHMERNGAAVVLVPRGVVRPAGAGAFRYELTVPGRLVIPEAGVILEAEGPWPGCTLERAADSVAVDAGVLGRRVVIRSRQPGDRLRPLGLGGRKKLQDLFVDRKVSAGDRDRTPVVTDPAGRIVWVAGLALAEEFRVTTGTNGVIVLRLRRS